MTGALLILQYQGPSEPCLLAQSRSHMQHGYGQQSKQKCLGAARSLRSPFPVPLSQPAVSRRRHRVSQCSCQERVPGSVQPYPGFPNVMLASLSPADTDPHGAQLVLGLCTERCVSSAYLIVSAGSHSNEGEQRGLAVPDSIPSLRLQPASHVPANYNSQSVLTA